MTLQDMQTAADIFANRARVRARLYDVVGVPDTGIDLQRGKIGGRKGSDPAYIPPKPPEPVAPPIAVIPQKLLPICLYAPELAFVFETAVPDEPEAAIDLRLLLPPSPTFSNILRAVCRHYNVSKIDILSDRRTANITLPRHVACYLLKTLTFRSLPQIGLLMGGRDHTTALNAIRRIEAKRAVNAAFDAEVASIEDGLRVVA